MAFATRKDIAMSSQFLVYPFPDLVKLLGDQHITNKRRVGGGKGRGGEGRMKRKRLIKWKNNLFLVTYSLIDACISFVYTLKYFLWKKAAFESTILYVPDHQTDHHPPYM